MPKSILKKFKSKDYSYIFNKKSGVFIRWGATLKDDPDFSPIGPEILDIELSTKCSGISGKPCAFCYKGNNPSGKHMSFETFKIVLDKMKGNLLQLAAGIGDLDPENGGNPDMFPMFEYAREHGVIPNVTINGWGLTNELAKRFASVCGAVAVSKYEPKDVCYDAVEKLTKAGLKQVNIHMMVSQESLDRCWELVHDMETDKRLAKLNAAVFLSLKQRGRGVAFHSVKFEDFKKLTDYALDHKLKIGFDSCTANKFLQAIEGRPEEHQLKTFVEPCESGLFSSYVNVDAKFYFCSFGEDGEGQDVLTCDDFVKDIWFSAQTKKWRETLLNCKRHCPIYTI